MQRFVADQRHRERDGLPSLAIKRTDGTASTVTTVTRAVVFNAVRKLLREAMDRGTAERLGLDREFITAMPHAGASTGRARRPFPDEVARALAAETNLTQLAADNDPQDWGLRDIWETVVTTGRRIGEVLNVRWDCLGRYGGLPMFWHDQTKVGNYDTAIRIPSAYTTSSPSGSARPSTCSPPGTAADRPARNAPGSPCSPPPTATPTAPSR